MLPSTQTGHPFAERTTTVKVENQGDTEHNLEEITREALMSWNQNSERYTGFDIDLRLTNTESPDFVLAYVDTPDSCHDVEGYTEHVLGCAPVIQVGHRIQRPVTATVVASTRPIGSIRATTKHEIGHVLGLGHQDEPLDVMSNQPMHRIPMYNLRIEIWEQVLDSNELLNTASDVYRDASSHWRGERYTEARQGFTEARNKYQESIEVLNSALTKSNGFQGQNLDETLDLDALTHNLQGLIEKIGYAVNFSDEMKQASHQVIQSNPRNTQSHIDNANNYIDSYNEAHSPALRDIAIALGLVKGFNREETAAPSPEEQEL